MGARGEPVRDFGQKRRLHDAVLVVPSFWPRIGEKDVNGRKTRRIRQRCQEIPGIGPDEMKVPKAGALLLAFGAADPIEFDVDSDAKLAGMGCGVGGQEVSMAAAEFQDERIGPGQDFGAPGPENPAAFRNTGQMFRGSLWIFYSVGFWQFLFSRKEITFSQPLPCPIRSKQAKC